MTDQETLDTLADHLDADNWKGARFLADELVAKCDRAEGIEKGVERVVHAAAPLQDAIASWREPGPAASSPATPAAAPLPVTLHRCGRCGIFSDAACERSDCPMPRRGAR